MGVRRGDERDDEQRRGYRYQPMEVPSGEPDPDDPDLEAGHDADDADADGDDAEFEEDLDERPSEFWPAAEALKGATIEDAELELSYAASVYANLPAAELRLWLRLPDGARRLVQVDEPHGVWLYRGVRGGDPREFEEYPDHRFELLCSDVRAGRGRRQRQLIDRQLALHEELVAVGEELEELERDMREDEQATAGWPGTRWP